MGGGYIQYRLRMRADKSYSLSDRFSSFVRPQEWRSWEQCAEGADLEAILKLPGVYKDAANLLRKKAKMLKPGKSVQITYARNFSI